MKIEDVYGNLPTLTTERLILRKITHEDMNDMFVYTSNDEVSRYVTWDTHRTLTDTKQFIDLVLHNYANKKIAPWAIEHKVTKKMIGTIDFVSWSPSHHVAEIGYVLSQDFWGKGLMTEAARAIIAFGFEKMELVRIQARCISENLGSERVMQKAGMTLEGIMRKAMLTKGAHRDMKLYAILKEEFNAFNKHP